MHHGMAGRWIRAAAVIVGLLAAAPGGARAAEAPACTCRYAGQSYALETCVCIVTPRGARMACCGMVLNNTSWKFTADACPVAGVSPPTGQGRTPDVPGQVAATAE